MARRLWFGLAIVTNFVVATALSCSFLWWGFGKVICADYVSTSVSAPAPDYPRPINGISLESDYVAYVWSRNCGATTSYNTIVYVAKPSAHWPDSRESVFESTLAPKSIQLRWDSHT